MLQQFFYNYCWNLDYNQHCIAICLTICKPSLDKKPTMPHKIPFKLNVICLLHWLFQLLHILLNENNRSSCQRFGFLIIFEEITFDWHKILFEDHFQEVSSLGLVLARCHPHLYYMKLTRNAWLKNIFFGFFGGGSIVSIDFFCRLNTHSSTKRNPEPLIVRLKKVESWESSDRRPASVSCDGATTTSCRIVEYFN